MYLEFRVPEQYKRNDIWSNISRMLDQTGIVQMLDEIEYKVYSKSKMFKDRVEARIRLKDKEFLELDQTRIMYNSKYENGIFINTDFIMNSFEISYDDRVKMVRAGFSNRDLYPGTNMTIFEIVKILEYGKEGFPTLKVVSQALQGIA